MRDAYEYRLQVYNNQCLSISKPPIILIIRCACERFASFFRMRHQECTLQIVKTLPFIKNISTQRVINIVNIC